MSDETKPSTSELPQFHPNAAGIDIGSNSHFIAIPADRCDEPVQEFQCFTSDLHRAAQWAKRAWNNHRCHGICRHILVTLLCGSTYPAYAKSVALNES